MSLSAAFLERAVAYEIRKEVFFAIRTDGVMGSGTQEDPYNGSTDTWLDGILIDPTLITSDMTICFGPGIFQTKGFNPLHGGWTPKSLQRLRGAGMHQTTLELVKAQGSSEIGLVFGIISTNQPVTDIEISDMTLDANLSRQPGPASLLVRADGVSFYEGGGTRIAIRRVRVINWGTHTPLTATGTHEGFPLYIKSGTGGQTGESIVEDCIVEQPDLWPAREVTLLNNSASPGSPNLNTTVRNNYVNGDFTTGSPPPPIEVQSLTDTSPSVTFRTKWPHRL